MTDQYEVLDALRAIVSKNSPFTTWTVSTPHLVMLWEKAQELERQACLARADTALLGAERALRNRVIRSIRKGDKS
jgi:hypothetical protein